MAKKKFKGDIEVANPYPTPGVVVPQQYKAPDMMKVKANRKKPDIVKSSEIMFGDVQLFLRRENPKPKSMKSIEKDIYNRRVLKNPKKYAKLS